MKKMWIDYVQYCNDCHENRKNHKLGVRFTNIMSIIICGIIIGACYFTCMLSNSKKKEVKEDEEL